MEAELTLEPLPEKLPEAVAFSPERPAAAALETVGVIPPKIAERVTIAPQPSWVVARPLQLNTEKASASNQYLLIDRQHHVGRHESYERVVRRLDTISALQEAGQFRIDFDPRSQQLTIHSLTVVRGGQRGENARMDRLRLLQRESGLEHLVIEGLLTVVALLEDVRIGDVLDLSYTVRWRSPIFPDRFWCWVPIPEQLPLRAFHLSARFATGHAMQWKSNDPKLTPTIREEDGETEWSWKTSVTPVAELENNVPAWNRVGNWIQMTDFTSWAEVAAGFAAAWQEDLQNPKITRLSESIASKAATPAQRAVQALTFLQDDVRYLSVSGDLGGQVPTPPGLMLQRGFGDCKDKSFAAAHLLRRLGVPARPVLVHAAFGESIREFLPMPGAFNHAIVEYDIEGQRRWVDVTSSLQGGTALSRPGTPFRLGLPIGPGVRTVEPIATDASSDRTELRETFLIDTSGRTSSLRVVITATGREAERWRRSMAQDGPEVFARWREQFYQRVFPHAKRAGKLEWEDDRESNVFVLGEVFDLHELGSTSYEGRGIRFRLSAHTIQSVLSFYQRGKRRNPWILPFPCRIKHIIELDSPSLRPPRGQSARVDGSAFRFSSNWQGHQGFNSITFTLQILEDCVPPSEFEDFKKDVHEVWRRTTVVAGLPAGSSVPWKKRSPGNVLPPKRSPASIPPREQSYAPPEQSLPLSTIAPACASPKVVSSGASADSRGEKNSLTPRRENTARTFAPAPARERNKMHRPNPSLPPADELIAASTRRRGSRRRAREAQRGRKRLLWGFLITFGALILLGCWLFCSIRDEFFHPRQTLLNQDPL